MTAFQLLCTIMIAAIVTLFTRSISFLAFRQGKTPPQFIVWLGGVLPRAVMAMLVIYCLKDVHFGSFSAFFPSLIGVIITCILHLWKHQIILSICGGTAAYMILLHLWA